MGIINKKLISTNSLQESFFQEIGKPLDKNSSIEYKDGVIELETYYPTNVAGKKVFHINFFQLDMDIWEENKFPTFFIDASNGICWELEPRTNP